MRRRLTVTGSTQNIDGSLKPGASQSGDLKKYKGYKQDQVSAMSMSRRIFLFLCACVEFKLNSFLDLT